MFLFGLVFLFICYFCFGEKISCYNDVEFVRISKKKIIMYRGFYWLQDFQLFNNDYLIGAIKRLLYMPGILGYVLYVLFRVFWLCIKLPWLWKYYFVTFYFIAYYIVMLLCLTLCKINWFFISQFRFVMFCFISITSILFSIFYIKSKKIEMKIYICSEYLICACTIFYVLISNIYFE